MRTPSLRRRATLWTVGVLAVLLTVVGLGVDLALGAVLRSEQEEPAALRRGTGPRADRPVDQRLADRLTFAGITATVDDGSGDQVVGVPQAPPAGGPGPRGGPRPPDARPPRRSKWSGAATRSPRRRPCGRASS